MSIYLSELKIWPLDGIESRPISTIAKAIGIALYTMAFAIAEMRRLEPVRRPNFEFT